MPARQQKDARERRKPEHDFERAPARARRQLPGNLRGEGHGGFFEAGSGYLPLKGGGRPRSGREGVAIPAPSLPFSRGGRCLRLAGSQIRFVVPRREVAGDRGHMTVGYSAGWAAARARAGLGAPTRKRRSDSDIAPPSTMTAAPNQISSTSGL